MTNGRTPSFPTHFKSAATAMRDYVLIYINGIRHELRNEAVYQALTDFLRYDLALTGTKVVCAEGDCGSCTVLSGRPESGAMRYQGLDGCIQYLWQLDGRHVVTVEGLQNNGCLHPVQEAMVESFGSQCGYCTPGFVMGIVAMLEENAPLTRQGVKDGLTGNLCRCTGYEQIIDAALALKGKSVTPITERYHDPQMCAELEACAQNSVEISYRESWGHESRNVRIGLPTTLAEAVAFKAQHEKTVVVSGGTDISVQMNKGKTEPETLLSLVHLQELEGVSENDGWLKIGAKATWTDMERACGESLPEFRKIIQVFASAQIKNAGTLAGNVGNGSPIADSMPFLFVMDAEVELTGPSGSRWVNINHFYHGYKQLELRPDELITALRLQLPKSNETLKLYKVSKRKDLDISTFTAGIRMALEDATISQASVAYGGVGPVVLRLPETEQFLSGKPLTLETVRKAGKLARREITPISDVRASKDYRLQLAENILLKFYHEVRQEQGWLQPDILSA